MSAAPPSTPVVDPLARHAHAWRAEGRRRIFLETACAVIAAGTILVSGVCVADRALGLPHWIRVVGLALAAGSAILTTRRAYRDRWRRLTWDAVFSAAARRWPTTRPLLASAWALSAAPPQAGASEELRLEHVARARLMAESLPAESVFPGGFSSFNKRLLAVAAATLTVALLFGDASSWQRAAAPWLDRSIDDQVVLAPGDAEVDWGAPASVYVTLKRPGAGVRSSGLALQTRSSAGEWRDAEWTRLVGGRAEWTGEPLTAPLDYRLHLQGETGRTHRLTPVAPPRCARAAAIVRGARETNRISLGAEVVVRARRGDWIVVECDPEGAVASAAVRISGVGAPLEMKAVGASWTAGFPANSDAAFSIELQSSSGRRDPSPPAYVIVVAVDTPPTAELLSPQIALVASPRDSIPIVYAARDDDAVVGVSLVTRASGAAVKMIPLPVPAPARTEINGEYQWSLKGYAPGQTVEFWIEAKDGANPSQVGRSVSASVQLIDADALHGAALSALDHARTALEEAAERATIAARAAAKLGPQAAATERALREAWSVAAKRLGDWSAAISADPRGDAELAEQSGPFAQEFSGSGRTGLTAAEAALAKGDAAAAAREENSLAATARGAAQAIKDGRRSQAALDAAEDLADASARAEDLARAAARLAARGKAGSVSAAEIAELERALQDVDRALAALRAAGRTDGEPSPNSLSGAEEAEAAAAALRTALSAGDFTAAAKEAARLARALKSLSNKLSAAQRADADSRGRAGSSTGESLRLRWQEAVDRQTLAVEGVRRIEGARTKRLLEVQRTGLDAGRRAVQTIIAAARPEPLPAVAANLLGAAQTRLLEGDATGALRALQAAAAAARGKDARSIADAAVVLSSLPTSVPADAGAAATVAPTQSAALVAGRRLRDEITLISRQLGLAAGQLQRRVESALELEAAAEKELRSADTARALEHAEAALAALEEGARDAASASASASSTGRPTGTDGSRPGAARAPRGGGVGRVRLPSAEDFRPPADLRRELERSLGEPRPSARDADVKEYLKRLAR